MPQTYPLETFGRFMSDRTRTTAYYEALKHTVTPDSVVLNIGAGTGLFALLAAQLGARRVIAIEANNIIDIARQIAEANGLAGHIEFIQSVSTEVTLDERADIIISDLRGVLPLFEHHIETIVDARERLLASGGILLPGEDRLFAALVRVPTTYKRRYDAPWMHNDFNLDMRAVRAITINDWRRAHLRPSQLASDTIQVATFDYNTVSESGLDATLTWSIESSSTLHGFALWFDAKIHEHFRFSNAPGGPKLIYGQAFFPFEFPIHTDPGDTVTVNVSADLYLDKYIWKWLTNVKTTSGDMKYAYRQSTIWSLLTSTSYLQLPSSDSRI